MFRIKGQSGQTLLEIIIAIGLTAIFLPALISGIVASKSGKAQQTQRLEALQILKQEEEATRAVRNEDWLNVGNGIYHPEVSNVAVFPFKKWVLTPGSLPVGSYTESVTITGVNREAGLIALLGYPDPSLKKVELTVSWNTPLFSQVSSSFYLSRYLNNNFFIDTSVQDFSKPGSLFTSTEAVSPSHNNTSADGQVVLKYSPAGADWCDPGNHMVTQINLGGNGLTGNVVAGIDRAFVGTAKNASSHPFYNVSINNSIYPPVPSVAANGYYDAPGLKANDVFGESHYAYLAPDKNSSDEVIILNADNTPPTVIASIDISGNKGSNNVFVSNNILYFIASNNKLYAYNITDRSKPTSAGSPIDIGGTSSKMSVVNGYVFIAMQSSSNQLVIIDARDPGKMSKIASLTVNNQPGVSVFVSADGSRTYFVTARSGSNKNFFIINTSNPKTPFALGSGYNTGSMDPRGLTVIDNRAIIVGFNGAKYQVVKVDNDNYVQCAAFSGIDNIYNVSSIRVEDHAYSYIVTDNTSKAFQIIEGGMGGSGGYASNGTYESGTSWSGLAMPVPSPVAFNRFDVTYVKPLKTDILFSVAVADAVGGSCSSFSYAGPALPPDSGTFSTGAGNGSSPVTESFPIPFGSNIQGFLNPGKCFRYKAILSTTDSLVTPAINDVTVNFSP